MVGPDHRPDDGPVNVLRRIPLHWLLYVATLASALPVAAVVAWATPMPEGACSGIGWGCSLYEWDAAGFALIIFGVPYAAALATVLFILTFVGKRAAPIVGWIGFAIPWLFAVFLALAD